MSVMAIFRQLTFASWCNVTPCNTIPDMPSEWNLHYARWVIQDGEPDRDVGESFEWFAVEFWSESGLVTAKDVNERSAVPIADFKYLVTAQVAFVSEKASVIDFGIRAIGPHALLPSECKDGDYVTGEIAIGLPLCTDIVPQEVLLTLKRGWHVNRISADLTPYISHPDDPKWQVRDISRVCYEQVPATHSVKARSYILHCSEALNAE
jgi:hypothetical protein